MVSKEAKLREFEDYLYINLKEIVQETGDSLLAAYRISLMIACHSEEVDPIRLDFYLTKLKIDRSVMEAAIRYFVGAGFLILTEDSPLSDPNTPEFQTGEFGKQNHTEMWLSTKEHISDFREAFWADTW